MKVRPPLEMPYLLFFSLSLSLSLCLDRVPGMQGKLFKHICDGKGPHEQSRAQVQAAVQTTGHAAKNIIYGMELLRCTMER